MPVILSSLSIAWMLPWVDDSMPLGDLALTSVHMVLFLAPIYAATFAWSSLGSEPMRISFVMLFLSVLAFAMYLVEAVTNYTPYRIVDIRVFLEIEKTGQLDWYHVPLVAATLVGYVVGLRSFLLPDALSDQRQPALIQASSALSSSATSTPSRAASRARSRARPAAARSRAPVIPDSATPSASRRHPARSSAK